MQQFAALCSLICNFSVALLTIPFINSKPSTHHDALATTMIMHTLPVFFASISNCDSVAFPALLSGLDETETTDLFAQNPVIVCVEIGEN